MARGKHKPQRTCVVCRAVKDKRELIRVVKTPEGQVIIDPTGKANGRGAYLCRQSTCWEKGLQKGRLSQALKLSITTQQIEELRASLQTERSKADE